MNLPVFKQMHYVSPSSFGSHKNCEYLTYLSRLAGFKEFMKDEQNEAAAIGTAFDLFIKDKIERECKLPTNHLLTLGHLLTTTIDKQHREVAEKWGRKISEIYIKLGFLDRVTDFRGDVHINSELRGNVHGVPIFGILDLSLDKLPVDWKTRGFTSVKGAYPKKGWSKRWKYDLSSGKVVREEARSEDKYHLEKVYEPWAIQMLFYNWMLGNTVYRYEIEEICKHGDVIEFAHHKGSISEPFATKIAEELCIMWDKLFGKMYWAEIEEPHPNTWMCEKFGTICKAAHVCKFYEATLGSEENRSMYT